MFSITPQQDEGFAATPHFVIDQTDGFGILNEAKFKARSAADASDPMPRSCRTRRCR